MKPSHVIAMLSLATACSAVSATPNSFACLSDVCIGDSLATVAKKVSPDLAKDKYYMKMWDKFPSCSQIAQTLGDGSPTEVHHLIQGGGSLVLGFTRAVSAIQGEHYVVNSIETSYSGNFTPEAVQEALETIFERNEIFRDPLGQTPIPKRWVTENHPRDFAGSMRGGAAIMVTVRPMSINVKVTETDWPSDFAQTVDSRKLESQPGCTSEPVVAPIVTALPSALKQSPGGAAYKNPYVEQAERDQAAPKDSTLHMSDMLVEFLGFFMFFGTLVLTLIIGIKARIGTKALIKPAITGLAAVGFYKAIQQLVTAVLNKYSNKEMTPAQHEEMMNFLTQFDEETGATQSLFNGIFTGLTLTAKCFVGGVPLLTAYLIYQGGADHWGIALMIMTFYLGVLPVACRTGEYLLSPVRTHLSNQIIFGNTMAVYALKNSIALALFLASFVVGFVAFPFFAMKLAWSLSQALQTLEDALAQLPEKS